MTLIVALFLIAALPAVAPAQSDPVVESRRHFRAAVEAYEAGDRAAYLKHAREAQMLRPAHGGVTWALASALALSGDSAGAYRVLRHFAALGYSGDLAADSDFASLRGSEAYAELTRRLEANRTPVVVSPVAYELHETDLLTEGIAHDSADGTFFVGSVRKGKSCGSLETAGPPPSPRWRAGAGRRSGSGWTSPAARSGWPLRPCPRRPRISGPTAAEARSSCMSCAPDAWRAGTSRATTSSTRIGDLIVTRAGDVLATDSRVPVVYRIRAGSDSLERFIQSSLLLSAQGLALAPDERSLYLADYARGILRVDLASRSVTLMQTADSVLALGIDGLYYHEGHLINIQNGVAPHRVVRLALSPAGDRIVEARVLERAHPRYQEPTLGVLVNRELFYIANSQWERFGQDGGIPDSTALERPVVLRLPL